MTVFAHPIQQYTQSVAEQLERTEDYPKWVLKAPEVSDE